MPSQMFTSLHRRFYALNVVVIVLLLLKPRSGSWILVISVLLLLTGVIRAVLALLVLRRIAAETSPVTPSPSPRLT